MCECGASLCDQRIWMSAPDYDGLAGAEPLIAPGHGPADGGELGKCPVCGRREGRKRRKRR
jgi:hypothetical protein